MTAGRRLVILLGVIALVALSVVGGVSLTTPDQATAELLGLRVLPPRTRQSRRAG